uniref:ATP synthase complex subunit 8 n=1 Tax=Cramptonomyia spenceri TaxID=209689 RepID=G8J8E1_9DIPT|nr:ATP synthase F0 subunit 8 [Cramptonomyia spenceri]AET13059.1 ATP synthase F0 subunit 8 [Cramptonomyia spenceri]
MPQMAPLSWLILFLFFSSIFLLFNMTNYFSYFIKSPSQNPINNNIKHNSLTWKW